MASPAPSGISQECYIGRRQGRDAVRSLLLLLIDAWGQSLRSFEDVGKPRADCCAPRLAELNPYVTVSVMKNGSSGEAMGSLHSCDVDEWRRASGGIGVWRSVMLLSEEELKAIDDACRRENVCLVACESRGASALFCDFGDDWTVTDADGELGAACLVASITQTNPALITVVDEQRHGLEVGDIVSLTACVGCDSLNERELKVLRVCSPYSYEVDADASSHHTLRVVGLRPAQEGRQGHTTQPYSSQLSDSFLRCDFAKFEDPLLYITPSRRCASGALPMEEPSLPTRTLSQ